MFITILFIVLFLIIFYIILGLYVKRKKNIENNLCNYFLKTIRITNNFTENDVENHIKDFKYTHDLYQIDNGSNGGGGDKKEWDPSLFIKTCLLSLNILSIYNDKTSIYYHDEKIWKILLFTSRVLCIKIETDDGVVNFINNTELYNVLNAFLVSMYSSNKNKWKYNKNNEKEEELFANVKKYFKFNRFLIDTDTDTTTIKSKVSDNCRKSIRMCSKFLEELNLSNFYI